MSEQPSHGENLAAVAAANEAGQLVDWTRVRTACPVCGQREVVNVRQVFQAKPPGTFSLAGVQMKVPAKIAWVYRCTACGAEGSAEPK